MNFLLLVAAGRLGAVQDLQEAQPTAVAAAAAPRARAALLLIHGQPAAYSAPTRPLRLLLLDLPDAHADADADADADAEASVRLRLPRGLLRRLPPLRQPSGTGYRRWVLRRRRGQHDKEEG